MWEAEMTIAWAERVAQQFQPSGKGDWATPGALARFLDPRTVQTPMLDVIDEACVKVFDQAFSKTQDQGPRLIVTTPPQQGKSERLSRRFPYWALLKNPDLRIAIASAESTLAEGWSEKIRDDIVDGPDLGLKVRRGRKAARRFWKLAGRQGSVYATGVGGSLTGRPVDLLIIDDPIKSREEADSKNHRDKVWDWWNDVARTRLAPGAPVIVIMTRWHPDDLAGRLLKEGGWDLIKIQAQCEDPATDVLKRELGEFMESTRGWTKAQWQKLKETSPVRTWQAMYQQSPTPAEGLVFQRSWIDNNRRPSGEILHALTRIIVSVDPAAKAKVMSDETGIVVVGLDVKGHAWVLDDRSLRGSPTEWGLAAWNALIDWRATEIVVEDNQGGDMVTTVLNTTWDIAVAAHGAKMLVPLITQVTANQSKRVRAEAAGALYELGRVHHASDGTDRLKILEDQMTTWTGEGSSPDRIDALVHGLRGLATPRININGRKARTR